MKQVNVRYSTFYDFHIFMAFGIQRKPPEVVCKKNRSQKFRKIHRKTHVPETVVQVFSCEFCKISKNTFSAEHLRTTASGHQHIILYALYCRKDGRLLYVNCFKKHFEWIYKMVGNSCLRMRNNKRKLKIRKKK